MRITVAENLWLELVDDDHAAAIFNLVEANRNYLQTWMPWVAHMTSDALMKEFVNGTKFRNANGTEFSFVIIYENVMVGRIGIYRIDSKNKIAELGYWIAEKFAGKGIITKSCGTLTTYCFNILNLNRVEIKCATKNFQSQKVPQRLNYKFEGILRQAEFHGNGFNDLNLYAMIKEDWSY